MKSKIYSFTLITIIVLGLANQNFAQWTQLTEIPTARTFSASCEVDSIIYVLGGTGSTNTNGSGTTIMDVYSPILNSWDTTKADMPTGRVELGVCAVNKKIYAIGGAANHGSSPLGMVEEYNPLTDSWETNKTPMPTPRKGAAIGVIDNKIYVAGGTAVSNFTASNKLEIYDPATNTWETKEPMPQSMYQPQGAVVNNKFYVIGGLLGFSPWTGQKIVQMYDPITDTWSYRADLNEGRVGHTTNVIDGKIYAIGGDKQPPPIRTVEEYDPNSNNWAVIDSTPGVMVCHTASVVQSKIYVISGSTSPIHPNLNPTDAVWSYQPVKENTFQLGSFEYEGRTRNYEVYLPYNYHTNMPVVFALHGYTETVQWFKDYTQLHKLGNTTGFITVYPAAIGKSWNSGLIAPGWPYIDTTVNDVGFISALIDTLEANYDIDMNRIYCCGYSLGGEMTYRLAIELGYRFAAVASVCGLINDVSGNLGDPIRPIPILHIHGTEDNYETWNGDDKNLWTVPETINFWLEKNDCLLQADTVTLPNLDITDGCTVEKISYTDCAENSCFLFYKIINGGHSWPGSSFAWNGEGNKNKDINANEEIWNFFKNYQNPLVNIAFGKSVETYPEYVKPEGDTLKITATIYNPEDHPVKVFSIIEEYQDTIELFDNGLYGNGVLSDNIFSGSKWVENYDEGVYNVKLFTTDLAESLTTYCTTTNQFTVVTEIEEELNVPQVFNLEQNYPNPFNPTTKINYSIPKRSKVVIKVYDILGKEVTALVNEEKPAGNYEVEFDASNLSSGVYFYQLRSGDFMETKKMILLR